jgi:peroxiredoxin
MAWSVRAGETVTPRELATIASGPFRLPDPEHLVHLQFRRYSGCPICHLHLRSFADRHTEIAAAGVREVAVFHSSAETMTGYQAELPFAVVADPARQLYRDFGVERSWRTVLHPSAWMAVIRGWSRSLPADDGSGHLGRPADFLIAPDGRLLACRYGAHANDQWSVDDLLRLARVHST